MPSILSRFGDAFCGKGTESQERVAAVGLARVLITICAIVIGSCTLSSSGCTPPTSQSLPQSTSPAKPIPQESSEIEPPATKAGPFQFDEVAGKSGLNFQHHSPLTEQRHTHLVMGSGIGWIDVDRDGWPDVYCCQGATYAANDQTPPQEPQPQNSLYLNHDGESFNDITGHIAATNTSYSMGVAVADFDNDGFDDLCVTGYEHNRLYRNNGDGTFQVVPLPTQSAPGRFSASCAWGDIDGDGDLDLFITNYAKLGPDKYPVCDYTGAGKTIHIVCHPSLIEPEPDLLYLNTGDGNFVDWSQDAGLRTVKAHPGLGVVAADLDGDGDTDFFVANDSTENHLWVNQGDGHFDQRSRKTGTSANKHGATEAGMGIAIGDVDGTGTLDMFVTNFFQETNTLYRNDGSLLFSDVTDAMGLGAPSRLNLSFGTSFADFDNDGWLDLLTANGHIHDRLQEVGRSGSFAQLPRVFRNERGIRFEEMSSSAGTYFGEPHVGRGTAIADYDRDGDVDIAISHLNGSASLLKNQASGQGHWLSLELIGITSNRNAIGAILRVALPDRVLLRNVQAGSSYLSCDDTTVLLGLGSVDMVPKVTVTWPSGQHQSWTNLPSDQVLRLIEGNGTTITSNHP